MTTAAPIAPPPVVVAGEALVDALPPTEPSGPRRLVPGGAPVNVAVAAARLGVDVAFAGPIGDDAAGDLVRRHLHDAGVPLALPRVRRPTARAVVDLDGDGNPSYAFEVRGTACDFAEVLPGRLRRARAAVVVGGAVGFASQPLGTSLALLPGALRVPVWLDPNVRLPSVGPDVRSRNRYAELVEVLAREADLVKCSDEDLRLLYGDDVDPIALARRWAASGPGLVVLTRGAEGMVGVTPSGSLVEVGPAPVPSGPDGRGDAVGAGDTVTGALLAWATRRGVLEARRLAGLRPGDLEDALRFAARAAAVTVSRSGADPPTLAELGEATPTSGGP